jgi:hypothetical protein
MILKPIIGIGLIIAVYFRLAKGIHAFGEPAPAAMHWIGIAIMSALAAWCFLSTFH